MFVCGFSAKVACSFLVYKNHGEASIKYKFSSQKNDVIFHNFDQIKGSDRLCKVVELSMQFCGKLLSDSFETY